MPNGEPAEFPGFPPEAGPTVYSGDLGSIYDLGWAHGSAVATGGIGGTVTDSELATLQSAFVAQYGHTWLENSLPYRTTSPVSLNVGQLTQQYYQTQLRAQLLADYEEQQALVESQWWVNTLLEAASGLSLGAGGALADLIWGETRSAGYGERESAFLLGSAPQFAAGGVGILRAALGVSAVGAGTTALAAEAVPTGVTIGARGLTIYRAVESAEAASIVTTGTFRLGTNTFVFVKQFYPTAAQANRTGYWLWTSGRGTIQLASARISAALVRQGSWRWIGGEGWVWEAPRHILPIVGARLRGLLPWW